MFTAKDLKEIINQIPDDTPIVMQSDDEGNGYRFMRGLEFIAEGEKSNFYHEENEQCIRKSEFAYFEIEDPKKEGYVLCAVAY